MTCGPTVLFADRLPPLVGGMEMHAGQFIEHFAGHPRFPLVGVVTRDDHTRNCLLVEGQREVIDLVGLPERFDPGVVFFNSGRWIEDLRDLRRAFSRATFIYRTGGNEILKAPLEHRNVPDHHERLALWVDTLNDTIDVLITNSAYTEARLQAAGITCRFERVVGGVNQPRVCPRRPVGGPIVFVCAARFVPYKRLDLLVDVLAELVLRGHDLILRLAGDGPLFPEILDRIAHTGLGDRVSLLGAIDNKSVCSEIAQADFYIQLSCDVLTAVPGGTYVHAEGMGRSILEAISCGTYVIAGHSGALSEIVTDYRGMLVDQKSAVAIADRIEPLLASQPRGVPTTEYDWNLVFARYERLWEKLP